MNQYVVPDYDCDLATWLILGDESALQANRAEASTWSHAARESFPGTCMLYSIHGANWGGLFSTRTDVATRFASANIPSSATRLHLEPALACQRRVAWPSSTATRSNDYSFANTIATAEFDSIVRSAAQETFEYGEYSEFEERTRSFLAQYRSVGVRAMSEGFNSLVGASPDAAYRLIDMLGSDSDPATHGARFSLLRGLLQASSSRIRDAAALALYRIGDIRVARLLRSTCARETNAQLRRNLTQLLDELSHAS